MSKGVQSIEERSFKKKTLRSFAVGLTAALLGVALWTWARSTPDQDGIPAAFRSALNWNAKLWAALSSSQRLTRQPSFLKPGKQPRINGNLGLEGALELSRWHLVVEGHPGLRLSRVELELLHKSETRSEFYCIEGWSDQISYGGIRFSEFLEKYHLGRRPDGSFYDYVALETPDKQYYVSIDMKSMLHPQTFLAWEMNGMPLSLENGAPLRLVIPIKYGIKSLKRIGRIYFSDQRPPDYWAEQGYDWYAGL